MSASNNSSHPQPTAMQSGTVYRKISDFLGNNPSLAANPKAIESQNTITNPYTNKKKRRYVDMIADSLCPSLSATITGHCYDKLRKIDNDLDVAIGKRHASVSSQLQNHNNTSYVTKVLRFELFNTFHLNECDPNKNKWSFKLQTKVLNTKESMYCHPLQSIISRIRFKWKTNEVEWNNINISDITDMDGIQIEREGNENCTMNLYVYLTNWFIPFNKMDTNRNVLCQLSTALRSLLCLGSLSSANKNNENDKRYHSKSEILQCLGYYVNMNNLIRKNNSMAIDCNKALQNIIGAKTIYSANLWKTLINKKHILAPEPIHIEHQICVTGDIKENAKIYDILVKVPSLIAMKASKLMDKNETQNNQYSLAIDSLKVQISDALEALNDTQKEQKLLEQYASDPVSTIDVIVSNQRENLQIIKDFSENAAIKSSQYFADLSMFPDIKRYLRKKQLEATNDTNDNHNH